MFILETLLMLMTTGLSVAKIIDLSHNHDANTFMSAGNPHYNHSVTFTGDVLPGIFNEFGKIFIGEHGGTHLDAPRHFDQSGKYLHEIPLEKTILTGVMIDCADQVKGNFDYVMPLQKLLDWEKEHGKIPDGAGVIINFGWSHRFHDPALYVGSTDVDDFRSFKHPIISKDSAEWLVAKRNVMLLGTDTMAPDVAKDKFPVHMAFMLDDRLIVENVRDPSRLPPRGFRLHAAPVKFVGASGAQIRLYAMTFEEDHNANTGQVVSPLNILMTSFCFLAAYLVFHPN